MCYIGILIFVLCVAICLHNLLYLLPLERQRHALRAMDELRLLCWIGYTLLYIESETQGLEHRTSQTDVLLLEWARRRISYMSEELLPSLCVEA